MFPGPYRRGLSEVGSSFRGSSAEEKKIIIIERGGTGRQNLCSTVVIYSYALLYILDGARKRLSGHKVLKPYPLHPYGDWKVRA